MQSLLEFMNRDRLKKYKRYNYFPKDREELIKIIKQLIKERGQEADLNDIDTSKITDMHELFRGIYIGLFFKTGPTSVFNGDISQWDVSNVENMENMFTCSNFDGDIEGWEVNPKCDMTRMFYGCPLEKHPPKWYKK